MIVWLRHWRRCRHGTAGHRRSNTARNGQRTTAVRTRANHNVRSMAVRCNHRLSTRRSMAVRLHERLSTRWCMTVRLHHRLSTAGGMATGHHRRRTVRHRSTAGTFAAACHDRHRRLAAATALHTAVHAGKRVRPPGVTRKQRPRTTRQTGLFAATKAAEQRCLSAFPRATVAGFGMRLRGPRGGRGEAGAASAGYVETASGCSKGQQAEEEQRGATHGFFPDRHFPTENQAFSERGKVRIPSIEPASW